MTAPVIAAVCGDAGGASAVAPVIEMLLSEARVTVHPLAYSQACDLWANRALAYELIPDSSTQTEIAQKLQRLDARLVLTGTSINQLEFEKKFISTAKALHIPSVSVLDYWVNYALRFSDQNGALAYLPDCIAVMDQTARDEMIAEHIDTSSIVITGHPAWDSLDDFRLTFNSWKKSLVRHELGIDGDSWFVLFASQPPSTPSSLVADSIDDTGEPPWLNRLHTVGKVIEALEALSKKYGKKAVLVIRLHPREKSELYRNIHSDIVKIVLQRQGDSRAVMMSADLVVGMAGTFLIESVCLGCRTLSIRLGFPLPDSFPPNRLGFIPAVYEEADVMESILTGLEGGVSGMGFPHSGNACRNVTDLVYSLLDLK